MFTNIRCEVKCSTNDVYVFFYGRMCASEKIPRVTF